MDLSQITASVSGVAIRKPKNAMQMPDTLLTVFGDIVRIGPRTIPSWLHGTRG